MKKSSVNVTAFCCRNALYPAAENEAANRVRVPGVDIIEVPCSGKVDAIYMLKAFEKGADGVVVVACRPEQCATIEGCARLSKRVEKTKRLLSEAGYVSGRLELMSVDAPAAGRLSALLGAFLKEIARLGPSPAR